MSKLTKITAALVVLAAVVFGLGPSFGDAGPTRLTTTAAEIEFFTQRVAADPDDVISATRLGISLRQHQRETGDIGALLEAEDVLRTALASLPGYPPTELALAKVLIDLHQFEEGLRLAIAANEADPSDEAQIAIGDVYLAIGDYDAAQAAFAALGDVGPTPPVMARQARLHEIRGEVESAVAIMEAARAAAVSHGMTGEPLAWFETRLADLHLSRGALGSAELAIHRARETFADYAPAYAAMGELLIARGDFEAAIREFEDALQISTDPDWLFVLSKLHRELGNLDGAAGYERLAIETIPTFGSIHPRDFALHYADKGEGSQALHFARIAFAQSQDPYAHDVLAWALHSAGKPDAALEHSRIAIASGVREAEFHRHAGAIMIGLGLVEEGERHLRTALEIGLDPWDATTVEDALAGLTAA